ncbi:hypothetical protein SLNWT_2233 [Streptomyces albus]|uniref:Uncharacterized protein n=1 Tax=Streptomyces albus (strain ATCC 21838 / DSM 41398 / FERM P-419 / JCM 4703 / NBRC 107858) TaxID=1081613 RepID=A0A0B5EM04_STRA4|nr:hypothetical protein SLNWT_2233 [Streptomyces albus]AOU76922.1 hypothetical protein SLNHY_2231 [Streptomyces albus]AYN32700.1 hypothetical protein DUI70_2197 [Streptomyces albus]
MRHLWTSGARPPARGPGSWCGTAPVRGNQQLIRRDPLLKASAPGASGSHGAAPGEGHPGGRTRAAGGVGGRAEDGRAYGAGRARERGRAGEGAGPGGRGSGAARAREEAGQAAPRWSERPAVGTAGVRTTRGRNSRCQNNPRSEQPVSEQPAVRTS